MNLVIHSPLASIEAVRPVFMVVMGTFLMVIAWRLCKSADGWAARLIVAGALLLGIGYAVIVPLYETGAIARFSPKAQTISNSAMFWHAMKQVVMNSGWLLFGLGLAIHAKVFSPTTPALELELSKSPQNELVS